MADEADTPRRKRGRPRKVAQEFLPQEKPFIKVKGSLARNSFYRQQLLTEAEQAIRNCKVWRKDDHGKWQETEAFGCPFKWRHNIRPFLLKLVREVPYASAWHWAIHCTKSFCHTAPFAYFRKVLYDPNKYRLLESNEQVNQHAMYKYLTGTKGIRIARAYAKRKGLSRRKYVVFTDERTGKEHRLDVSQITLAMIQKELDPQRRRAMEALWALKRGKAVEDLTPKRRSVIRVSLLRPVSSSALDHSTLSR